jgi:hypothetical protein
MNTDIQPLFKEFDERLAAHVELAAFDLAARSRVSVRLRWLWMRSCCARFSGVVRGRVRNRGIKAEGGGLIDRTP